ncbi:MAG: tetraacyldisaccharide 4'-kinase, partial [Planctomycetes bacterium]|nr:tetraacyldisaccharide 4'-kinase [Planctomycetota bacterium]
MAAPQRRRRTSMPSPNPQPPTPNPPGPCEAISMPGRWPEELPGSPWRWLLAPAWAGFALGAGLRGLAYDRGILPIPRLGVPVLSVGNL